MKIREGNDFAHNWEIERGGIAENLRSTISRKLFLKKHREAREITDYDIIGDGNIIHTRFTPDMLFGLGDYILELHYVLSDTSLSDEDRRCAVDVDAFTIVARTAMADNVTEMAQTSDIALALRGKSAYDLWLETHEGTEDDYFAYLRQPATDAAASVSELEQTVSDNEGLRVTAEQGRSDEELLRDGAENDRIEAEGIRDANEGDRIEAEGIRDENETDRINAEGDREDAEDLRELAEVAREEAEEARANAEGDATKGRVKAENERVTAEILRNETFDQKMGEADDKIEEMNTTLSTYDGRVSQAESDIDQLAGEVSLLDAVQGAKIRDIENVISTMNPNQSAQLSVSGRKVVSLPKNASNGGMQVKLEGLTAENLVVNGDFRNGLTGWTTYSGETPVVESGYLKLTPTSTLSAISNGLKQLSVGDKWYVRTIIKSSSPVAGSIGFSKSEVGTLLVAGNIGTSDTTISGILTIANADINGFVVGRPTVVQDIYIKNASAINLTATFGSGNEPDIATCDKMFSDYFDGVKSFVPTGRVRSVGKNLFPKLLELGTINQTTGANTASTTEARTSKIPFSGGMFRFSAPSGYRTLRVFMYDRSGLFLGVLLLAATSATFTTMVSTRYIRVTFDKSAAALTSTDIDTLKQGVQIEKGPLQTSYTKYVDTSLYLTAPELRSNGTVKDEIRKGANGYEHVKRVGVGTSNGEIVTGGDFSDPTKWVVGGGSAIISNGTLKLIADAGIASIVTQNKTITAGKIYRYKIDVLSISGAVFLYIGNTIVRSISIANSGKTISGFFLSSTGGTQIRLAKDLASNVSAEFDNISIFEYNPTEGVAIAGGEAVYGGNIHYTLATPVITPISYGGILNGAENGTVYHEPIIADAGVYGANMPILMTDYPIATIEEIIKHENGVDTYLNVATAVVASDGLSFTHPDLASGDLVLFTYAFDKESTNGNITASFYDSNVVKIDTVTGKAYRINEVVTNGVLTRTLTEV